MRVAQLPSGLLGSLFRPSTAAVTTTAFTGIRAQLQQRWSSSKRNPPVIPSPTPFVPDVATFFSLIGRDMTEHTSKFPSWDSLFSLSSDQLRELGIEPARTRRYLLRWRGRFRAGRFGPGGDFKYLDGDTAHLRIKEFVKKGGRVATRKAVNVPPGKLAHQIPKEELVIPAGYVVKEIRRIEGPYAIPLKGGGAWVKRTPGMWEDKRGRKIDGGERRRAMVRFLRCVKERRERREAMGSPFK